mgnify:CR=1 FL=1
MNTVFILRRLWRFRFFVALLALMAIAAGIFVLYEIPSMESRKYTVGVASARILVDTPASQVVDLSPEGSDSLGARTALLANLMVDGEIKNAIARQAGMQPDDFIGVNPDAGLPAAFDGAPPRDKTVLSTEVTMVSNSAWLPIIQVDTQAPKRADAERLANAAVVGLMRYLDTKAAAEAIPGAKRLRVSGVGVAEARDELRGPSLALAIAAGLGLFGLGCALLIGIAELVNALRSGPPAGTHADGVARESGSEGPSPQPSASAARTPGPVANVAERRQEESHGGETLTGADDAEAIVSAGATPPRSRSGSPTWWSGGPS